MQHQTKMKQLQSQNIQHGRVGCKSKIRTPELISKIAQYKREQPNIFVWKIRERLITEGISQKVPSISSINRIVNELDMYGTNRVVDTSTRQIRGCASSNNMMKSSSAIPFQYPYTFYKPQPFIPLYLRPSPDAIAPSFASMLNSMYWKRMFALNNEGAREGSVVMMKTTNSTQEGNVQPKEASCVVEHQRSSKSDFEGNGKDEESLMFGGKHCLDKNSSIECDETLMESRISTRPAKGIFRPYDLPDKSDFEGNGKDEESIMFGTKHCIDKNSSIDCDETLMESRISTWPAKGIFRPYDLPDKK